MPHPSHIHWPDDLDDHAFLKHYWQQKPLLCPQAFPSFDSPVSPDDLAFFACEPNTTPRLILQNDSGCTVEHGPFAEDRFESLTSNNWSLLVSDVEKHWPELQPYLSPFQFLPSWRIDDLMISYAPAGASVGAHVDAYDVFLLQASGTREWHINEDPKASFATTKAGDLAHIEDFKATHTFLLEPGDMLYLPPGVAHHGIAVDDQCTTWSIGFRAPSQSQIVEEISTAIMERLTDARFTDTGRAVAQPGEIDSNSLKQLQKMWNEAVSLSDEEFSAFAGCLLTHPQHQLEQNGGNSNNPATVEIHQEFTRNPYSQLAYIKGSEGNTAQLFADGNRHDCSLEFAQLLCQFNVGLALNRIIALNNEFSQKDQHLFKLLVANEVLIEA